MYPYHVLAQPPVDGGVVGVVRHDAPPAVLLELPEQHGPRGVVVLVDLIGKDDN